MHRLEWLRGSHLSRRNQKEMALPRLYNPIERAPAFARFQETRFSNFQQHFQLEEHITAESQMMLLGIQQHNANGIATQLCHTEIKQLSHTAR
ncbi:hypothetical protein Nepgr_008083 [Nepenthes gracilis]|uniref:Uncharacterized protein n=1 Tax=Nepenthes gracilis TaxID=150966 RepID=A0AAD3S813_NEPGR|nr:hypothetical protein Nepgr_008083 [Nepenthes gracilis]